MSRGLTWVIVTLPLAACICLWVDSYWHYTDVRCLRKWRHFGMAVDRGLVRVSSWTGQSEEHWYFEHEEGYGAEWSRDPRTVLGFGYIPEVRYVSLQFPTWSVALVAALPSLWFYRRQRKHRKVGFPVSPATEKT